MRKNRKQITALVLAMGMTAAGCMTGYAALDVDPTDAANPSTVTGDNGSAVSELIGQIDATTLSVTLPLKAGFNIDPTIYTEDDVCLLYTSPAWGNGTHRIRGVPDCTEPDSHGESRKQGLQHRV